MNPGFWTVPQLYISHPEPAEKSPKTLGRRRRVGDAMMQFVSGCTGPEIRLSPRDVRQRSPAMFDSVCASRLKTLPFVARNLVPPAGASGMDVVDMHVLIREIAGNGWNVMALARMRDSPESHTVKHYPMHFRPASHFEPQVVSNDLRFRICSAFPFLRTSEVGANKIAIVTGCPSLWRSSGAFLLLAANRQIPQYGWYWIKRRVPQAWLWLLRLAGARG
ncbi:hypothetical protein VTN77DRAFT_2048 [Rasamsonia byssochlamydoides]|uniref:uncharacterized protein n=1 Tax=Rasamsonia byssochlamydoides TaxID=89139 RepID=UPI0037445C20